MSSMAAFDALPKRVRDAMQDAVFPLDPSTISYQVWKHGEDWVIANIEEKKRAALDYQMDVGGRLRKEMRSYLT